MPSEIGKYQRCRLRKSRQSSLRSSVGVKISYGSKDRGAISLDSKSRHLQAIGP
jgi:hypothetical protein